MDTFFHILFLNRSSYAHDSDVVWLVEWTGTNHDQQQKYRQQQRQYSWKKILTFLSFLSISLAFDLRGVFVSCANSAY